MDCGSLPRAVRFAAPKGAVAGDIADGRAIGSPGPQHRRVRQPERTASL